ncbi:hypothetical protein KIN20_030130 [Parelaphostrongylus tenuis]|uniref:Uncharacterized protein n=1 Tax=Parelaphostrongylus tenuis TaxID=148309 RepID=A0AAD5R397_PARTN|nr:hypothetical protein KIN20_030130 [Parelaphostrongylus tenuis]
MLAYFDLIERRLLILDANAKQYLRDKAIRDEGIAESEHVIVLPVSIKLRVFELF